MKKLTILIFSLVISMNSYSGLFIEKNNCFETDGQNIVYLPNEDDPYTGIYLCKFDNGQKQKEGSYKNGKYDGKWTEWRENGQIEAELNYKNGKLDGKSTWWNKRGQKVIQKNYKNDNLDGKWTEWFQFNGEIKRERNFKNGKILF
jgi:antitoxin component YwqK of YwqJK toxin-antitoxin module